MALKYADVELLNRSLRDLREQATHATDLAQRDKIAQQELGQRRAASLAQVEQELLRRQQAERQHKETMTARSEEAAARRQHEGRLETSAERRAKAAEQSATIQQQIKQGTLENQTTHQILSVFGDLPPDAQKAVADAITKRMNIDLSKVPSSAYRGPKPPGQGTPSTVSEKDRILRELQKEYDATDDPAEKAKIQRRMDAASPEPSGGYRNFAGAGEFGEDLRITIPKSKAQEMLLQMEMKKKAAAEAEAAAATTKPSYGPFGILGGKQKTTAIQGSGAAAPTNAIPMSATAPDASNPLGNPAGFLAAGGPQPAGAPAARPTIPAVSPAVPPGSGLQVSSTNLLQTLDSPDKIHAAWASGKITRDAASRLYGTLFTNRLSTRLKDQGQ